MVIISFRKQDRPGQAELVSVIFEFHIQIHHQLVASAFKTPRCWRWKHLVVCIHSTWAWIRGMNGTMNTMNGNFSWFLWTVLFPGWVYSEFFSDFFTGSKVYAPSGKSGNGGSMKLWGHFAVSGTGTLHKVDDIMKGGYIQILQLSFSLTAKWLKRGHKCPHVFWCV